MLLKETKNLVEKVIEVIKTTTADGSWMKLTCSSLRPVLAKTDMEILNVLSMVRNDKRIKTKRENSKSEYEYQYCEEPEQEQTFYEEAKVNPAEVKTMHSTYKNLTEEEVKKAEEALFSHGITTPAKTNKLLSIYNTINSSIINKEQSVIDQVSNLLIEPRETIKDGISNLMKAGILKSEVRTVEKEVKPIIKAEKKETPKVEIKSEQKVEPKIEVKEENSKNQSELIAALSNFSNMQKDFYNYISKFTDSLENGINKEKYEILRQQYEQEKNNAIGTSQLLEKALDENSSLRDTIKQKDEELRANKAHVKVCREKTENVILNMQQNMEALLADITSSIVNYCQLPTWDKTPEKNKKFQAEVINAVTNTVNEVLAFNKTNGKVE